MDNSKINNPHDKFFRSAMENKPVAIEFFQHHLPEHIRQALDFNSLRLTYDNYINDELKEYISDLVFECQLADTQAYLVLLVEHQSTPDLWMPFRAGHYMFNYLHKRTKIHPQDKLPVLYTLVFYHGKPSPYPYSLYLQDCFNDPLELLPELWQQPLALVDVGQLSDETLKQQQWVGPMALAMKHIRDSDITAELLGILAILEQTAREDETQINNLVSFARALLNYVTSTGNIIDAQAFIEQTSQCASEPLRGEVMTIAEKLQELGMQKGMQDVALNLLREGTDPAFVARVTKLSLEEIQRLQYSMEDEQ